MPLGICQKHDRTGFVEMCEHVAASLKSGSHQDFHPLYYWYDLEVCRECWHRFNFAYFENHPDLVGKRFYEMFEDIDEETPIMKEYNQLYDNLCRKAWCMKCIKDIESTFVP